MRRFFDTQVHDTRALSPKVDYVAYNLFADYTLNIISFLNWVIVFFMDYFQLGVILL